MQVPDQPLEQARFLFDAIHVLRARLFPRHCPGQVTDAHGNAVDLTMGQMHMLMAIYHLEQSSLKDLAEALGVSAPSASVMLDRLVEHGLVTRGQNPHDRREVVVGLSPEGRAVVEEVHRHLLGGLEEVLRRVGPEVATQWCEVYAKVRAVLESEQDSERAPGVGARMDEAQSE